MTSPISSPQNTLKAKYKQADREALITLGLYAVFFLWWTLFAFGLGSGDPAKYSYTFGMPNWFFYSCVLGYPVLTIILWLVVRFAFTHIDLDNIDSDSNDGASVPPDSLQATQTTQHEMRHDD